MPAKRKLVARKTAKKARKAGRAAKRARMATPDVDAEQSDEREMTIVCGESKATVAGWSYLNKYIISLATLLTLQIRLQGKISREGWAEASRCHAWDATDARQVASAPQHRGCVSLSRHPFSPVLLLLSGTSSAPLLTFRVA